MKSTEQVVHLLATVRTQTVFWHFPLYWLLLRMGAAGESLGLGKQKGRATVPLHLAAPGRGGPVGKELASVRTDLLAHP